MRRMTKGSAVRTEVLKIMASKAVNFKQVKALVKKVQWYNAEPIGVGIGFSGELMAAWPFILIGIEKDGYAHT